jgi:hypothetical protein
MPNATASIVANLTGQNSSGTGNTTALNAIASNINKPFTTGTGANQVADILVQSGTVTSGSPVQVDLSGGLAPPVGSAPTPSRIVFIRLVNKSTTTGEVLDLGAGTNPVTTYMSGTTPTLKVGPGGHADLVSPIDGYAITAGTADALRIAASSGTISYDIFIGVR